jgi:hypothetical protein
MIKRIIKIQNHPRRVRLKWKLERLLYLSSLDYTISNILCTWDYGYGCGEFFKYEMFVQTRKKSNRINEIKKMLKIS